MIFRKSLKERLKAEGFKVKVTTGPKRFFWEKTIAGIEIKITFERTVTFYEIVNLYKGMRMEAKHAERQLRFFRNFKKTGEIR